MAKQVVFIVTTDDKGSAEAQGFCKSHGPLDGRVVSIQYLNDKVVPFDQTVSFKFIGADTHVEVFEIENVDGRATWAIDGCPELMNEPIKVVVTNGGANRSGSFVVTCK